MYFSQASLNTAEKGVNVTSNMMDVVLYLHCVYFCEVLDPSTEIIECLVSIHTGTTNQGSWSSLKQKSVLITDSVR